MKFLATFAYTADVLPKGSRKQRREVLYAKAEFEIADLSRSDLAIDAVVVEEAQARPGEQARRRYAFAGHDGGLWSPIAINTYVGKPKTDVAHFLKSCEVPWPAGPRSDNPLSDAFDQHWGPQNTGGSGREAVLERLEDNYDGRILSRSERAAAIDRCRAIAGDIVNVEGTVYVRRPEPVWEVQARPMADAVLRGAPSRTGSMHRFRLDRLGEARQWARPSPTARFEVGEIVRCDPAYLQRDDLSHFLADHLRPILDRVVSFLPYLDSARVAAWHRLARVKDEIGVRTDRPFPLPLDDALTDVRLLCDRLAELRLPASYLGIHDTFVREKLAPFMARFEFETVRRPAPAAPAAEDDAALACLGSR